MSVIKWARGWMTGRLPFKCQITWSHLSRETVPSFPQGSPSFPRKGFTSLIDDVPSVLAPSASHAVLGSEANVAEKTNAFMLRLPTLPRVPTLDLRLSSSLRDTSHHGEDVALALLPNHTVHVSSALRFMELSRPLYNPRRNSVVESLILSLAQVNP